MNHGKQKQTFNWKKFLSEYSLEVLSDENVRENLPTKAVKSGWLGFVGATEADIARTEKQIGINLPPSYRSFLLVSNGWRRPTQFSFDLLPAANISWFREQHQDWVDVYAETSGELPRISDDEYFVYGETQDCCNFRPEYLQTALQISEKGDSEIVLLNPQVVTPDGEWETWFFADWLPGAVRYRSFDEWLKAERNQFAKTLKSSRSGPAKTGNLSGKKGTTVKKAQSAAREGRTKQAIEALERFANEGDDGAAASLAEIYAFLGDWSKVIPNAGRLIANPQAVYASNVFHDMIRLLGRAGHQSSEWSRVAYAVKTAIKANDARVSDEAHGSSWKSPGKQLRNLLAYANRDGEAPHELLAIFGVQDVLDSLTIAERESHYLNAVRNVDSLRPELKKNPAARAEHLFGLATGYSKENEALRLYEAHGKSFLMAWQAAEKVARIYMKRRAPERAWEAIKTNLSKWWPVDNAQVAPVILLTDDLFNTFMGPDKCELVLAAPRGPEAAKKKS